MTLLGRGAWGGGEANRVWCLVSVDHQVARRPTRPRHWLDSDSYLGKWRTREGCQEEGSVNWLTMTHDELFTFIRSPRHWSKHFFFNLCNIIKSLFIIVPRNSRFDIWTCLYYTCMCFWWPYISLSLIGTLLAARRMKGIICIENKLSEDNAYDQSGCRSARNTDPAQKRERIFR